MNTMHNPPHPGELLQQLWLEPLNLSITEAARHLKVKLFGDKGYSGEKLSGQLR